MSKVNSRQRSLTGSRKDAVLPERCYAHGVRNDHILEFLVRWNAERGTDSEADTYDVAPFDRPITTSKSTALYNMHTFWSKKPHAAIREYISHYTKPGDLVLDVFSGSGGVGAACRQLSRNAILCDISPFCTFLSYNYASAHNLEETLNELDRILARLQCEYHWVYELGGQALEGFLFSDQLRCAKCLQLIYVADCEAEQSSAYVCPNCGEEWSTRSRTIEWVGGGEWGIFKKKGRAIDLRRITDQQRLELDRMNRRVHDELERFSLADTPIPQALLDLGGRLETTGTTTIKKLYSSRTQLILSKLFEQVAEIRDSALQESIRFVISSVLLNLTLMYQYRKGGGGKPGGGGAYYLPPLRRELNVFSAILSKRTDILKGRQEQIRDFDPDSLVVLTTEDNIGLLNRLPAESIDYVFTDPPYADTMPYAALNCVWDYWLFPGRADYREEVLGSNWRQKMEFVARELHRVLKPGRCVSVCYHDTSEGTWADLQDVMAIAGFVVEQVERAMSIDAAQKSYQQIRGDKVVRRDLIINFRKPVAGGIATAHLSIPRGADNKTFQELAQQIVAEFLTDHPGTSKDHVFDELVSRMVRRGEMEAHDFDAVLKAVAEEVSEGSETSRWYLKDSAGDLDSSEMQKEDAAAERLEKYMTKVLAESLELEGVHYSDLFEQVIGIPTGDRPRRLFENWLPEYFIKTSEGTWRPPADETERQQKAAIREAGTLRRMKRFANALLEEVPVRKQDRPDSTRTLAEWIRQCRRAGLYEQGRVMYEKGGLDLDRLDEDEQIEVEDDYRICVKRGSEEEPSKKSKGRKKTS